MKSDNYDQSSKSLSLKLVSPLSGIISILSIIYFISPNTISIVLESTFYGLRKSNIDDFELRIRNVALKNDATHNGNPDLDRPVQIAEVSFDIVKKKIGNSDGCHLKIRYKTFKDAKSSTNKPSYYSISDKVSFKEIMDDFQFQNKRYYYFTSKNEVETEAGVYSSSFIVPRDVHGDYQVCVEFMCSNNVDKLMHCQEF